LNTREEWHFRWKWDDFREGRAHDNMIRGIAGRLLKPRRLLRKRCCAALLSAG
jgi:hypothetical protein